MRWRFSPPESERAAIKARVPVLEWSARQQSARAEEEKISSFLFIDMHRLAFHYSRAVLYFTSGYSLRKQHADSMLNRQRPPSIAEKKKPAKNTASGSAGGLF